MAGRNSNRVVITGVGVVSPIGIGNDRFWESLLQNRSGIDFLQSVPGDGLPSAFGAEVRDFNPVSAVNSNSVPSCCSTVFKPSIDQYNRQSMLLFTENVLLKRTH